MDKTLGMDKMFPSQADQMEPFFFEQGLQRLCRVSELMAAETGGTRTVVTHGKAHKH